jgi:hypothetical protein
LGNRIKTVVFDEAHIYLGAHEARYPQHQKMLEYISKRPIQKIFLSATIPVGQMDIFLKKVHLLSNPPSHIIIRQNTSRPELAHHVLTVPPSVPATRSTLDITAELANGLQNCLDARERMIVFVMQVSDAESLSQVLGCPQYHSKLFGDYDDHGKGKARDIKAHNQSLWIEGKSNTIVATPALIQGIDYSWVRFIVFHLGSYGLVSYFQGAGRGGRSGSRCDVFTVCDSRNDFYLQKRPEDAEAAAEWKTFVVTTRCRISIISSCFDGIETDCSRIDGQQKCDNCDPSNQYHRLAQDIVCRQVAKVQQGGSSKRPLRTSSLEDIGEVFGEDWNEEELAMMDEIEGNALKKIKLDRGVAAVTRASSMVCSSPALSTFSSFKTPSALQGTPPRAMPVLNSALSRVNGFSDSALAKQQNSTVGNAIVQAAAAKAASDLEKKRKSKMLEQFMPAMANICPVCWILTGRRIPSQPVGPDASKDEHVPFFSCPFNELLGPNINPTFYQFLDFRKIINLRPDFSYCFTCAMPQSKGGNDLEPSFHAKAMRKSARRRTDAVGSSTPQQKTPRKCPWGNIIQASLFALYFDHSAMAKLLPHFCYADNPDGMTVNEWAEWLNTDLHDQGEYWKGLEVFLFKAAERGMILDSVDENKL